MVTDILSFNSLFCFLLTFTVQVTLEGRKIKGEDRRGEGRGERGGEGREGRGREESRKILISLITGLKAFTLHSVPPLLSAVLGYLSFRDMLSILWVSMTS